MDGGINSFKELYQQRKEWVDSSRKNGFEDGILNLLTELYPDNAHFIYELLQNAEDAKANEVNFTLLHDRLIFTHNAKHHFSFKDINSITSIGKTTKKDDVVQIGKFGVGFKAVFSYTTSPKVYSKQYNFEIRDLVIPYELNHSYSEDGNTVFEFPFDNPNKAKEKAFDEVKNALDALSVKTLLFLQNITTIKWTVEDKNAVIQKAEENGNYLSINKKTRDGLNTNTHWLKFSKPLTNQLNLSVSLAYKIEFKSKKILSYDNSVGLGEQFKVVIDPASNVSVYFPAEKESSNLKFNINAPFSSTVARDSVQNRPENNELISQLAELAGSSLEKVKELGLLNANFFEVLPNSNDEIPDFYKPIRNTILQEFVTTKLVPCLNNIYLPSIDVYESSASFRNVFDTNDLKYFVDKKQENIGWLVSCQGKRQRQFVSDLQINDWGIEELFEFLNVASEDAKDYYDDNEINKFRNWLNSKGLPWIKSFYVLLLKEGADEWGDYYYGNLCSHDILIAQNNTLTCADKCYFPLKLTNNEVNMLHSDFFPNNPTDIDEKVQKFFECIGVKTYGEKEKINLILDQYYRHGVTSKHTLEEHISHLKLFINYYLENKYDLSLFTATRLMFVDRKGYVTPKSTYLTSKYINLPLELYFDLTDSSEIYPISDIYFDCGIELDVLIDFFKSIGCHSKIDIKKVPIKNDNPEYKYLTSVYGKWTYLRVTVDFTIEKLENILSAKSLNLSKLLLQVLNESYESRIHSRAKYRPNGSEPYRYADSLLLYKLKSSSWIPSVDGKFAKPSEIKRHLIHPDFNNFKNKDLLKDIELFLQEDKQRALSGEKQQKAKDLGFESIEELERGKWFASLTGTEQERIINEISNQRANEKELPNYTPRNPELRRDRVLEEDNSSLTKQKEIRERSVAVGKSDAIEAAKQYLIAQYTDIDGVQICQVCQSELPFKKLKGGDYYFEAIEYCKASKKLSSQNYLCLCPNHAAMFKHANSFKGNLVKLLEKAENNRLKMELGGENETIYFTDTHLLDLKTILNVSPATDNTTQEKQHEKLEFSENKQIIVDSFNESFMERVKAIPNWNKAYLHNDEDGIWCLGSKNQIIIKSLTEQHAVKWWNVYISKFKPYNPKLIRK